MSDLNLKAKEFVPSWLQKPAGGAPAAAAPKGAPAPPPPTKPPAVTAPPPAAAPVAAPSATASKRHMNPNAAVFQPAGWPAPAAKPATPKMKAATAQLPPPLASAPPTSAARPQINVTTKTDAEVRAISQKSTLKVAAAVFIPGQRSNKLALAKPSPLTLTPVIPDAEMLLSDLWCLYILCSAVAKEDTFDPAPVFRIDSVATFWKTMNNLPEPTELPAPSTMYLFRDDINPKWEDPKNCQGGVYKLRVERSKIDIVWLLVACKTIGESWVKEHRNKVNGVVLKVREKSFYIEIWVTEKVEGLPTDLLHAVESELDSFNIDFFTHEEIQLVLKEAAAANAKKQKQNKGKRK